MINKLVIYQLRRYVEQQCKTASHAGMISGLFFKILWESFLKDRFQWDFLRMILEQPKFNATSSTETDGK